MAFESEKTLTSFIDRQQQQQQPMHCKVDDETGRLTYRCHMGIVLTSQGKFLYDELVPCRSLEDTIPFLEEKDRETFLSFARQMLAWLPGGEKDSSRVDRSPIPQAWWLIYRHVAFRLK